MHNMETLKNNWFVYIVECSKDKSLYTGITTDLEKRIIKHNNGRGAKYTKTRGPVELKFSIGPFNKSTASIYEANIKKLTRFKKELLIKTNLNWIHEEGQTLKVLLNNKFYGLFYDSKSPKQENVHLAEFIPYSKPPNITLCKNEFANFTSSGSLDGLCSKCFENIFQLKAKL